jgi:hypothetical protein
MARARHSFVIPRGVACGLQLSGKPVPRLRACARAGRAVGGDARQVVGEWADALSGNTYLRIESVDSATPRARNSDGVHASKHACMHAVAIFMLYGKQACMQAFEA